MRDSRRCLDQVWRAVSSDWRRSDLRGWELRIKERKCLLVPLRQRSEAGSRRPRMMSRSSTGSDVRDVLVVVV